MSTERIRVHRPVIYGSHARLLTDEERATAPPSHTHKWTVFLASAASPPPPQSSSAVPPPIDMDYLPGGADDLSYLIKRVTFRLHETYTNPNRVCDKPPYRVTETGWGEFVVQIKVNFVPESTEKTLALQHSIKLHHWGAPIEAAPSAPLPVTAPGTAAGTPAALADTADAAGSAAPEGEAGVKVEAGEKDAPASAEAAKTEQAAQPAPAGAPGSAPATAADALAAPMGEGGAADNALSGLAAPALSAGTQAVSIAASLPVHAWQYDELVFSDPPANFVELLAAHAATPLPPRNRRARDQREQHDAASGKKRKAGAGAGQGRARASMSRAPTEAPTPAPATPATPATPAPAAVVGVVGIPGEPGSADVPLEYSVEMEKAEWGRLNDARVSLVEQMDRWRERLIVKEKELAKLKESLA